MSKLRLLLETDDEIMSYVTVGLVHTRDHGSGCSGANLELAARQTGGGSYIRLIQEYNRR